MKILFITRRYLPSQGGVEKHIKEISNVLHRDGHTITILTVKHQGVIKNEEYIHSIKIKRFKEVKTRLFGLLHIWLWVLRAHKLFPDQDIVHTHDSAIWLLPIRLLYPSMKIYSTFHGWEGKYPIPIKNILLRRMGHVLSNKTITVGRFADKYYYTKSDLVIYGATRIPATTPRKKEGKVVYIGRLAKDTGLLQFLAAFRNLKKRYKILFCGEGEYKKQCRLYGTVKGFVNPQPILSESLICLTGGYLSSLEAMANKCLVFVAYNNPLKKDCFTMTPFSKWIIIEKDPARLAKKIEYYMEHPEKAKPMIEAAYKWVQGQTWEKLTDQYLELWGVKDKKIN